MASEIGVQKIQHTNGTDAMTIDSSGRVFRSVVPAFSAYLNSTHNIASAATDEKIVFNAEIFDHGGGFNTTTGEYTAPVSGLYQINFNLNFSGSGQSARYVRGRLYKNGSFSTDMVQVHNHISNETGDADYAQCGLATVVDLTANDVLSIYAATSNDALVVAPTTRSTHFSGFLIG